MTPRLVPHNRRLSYALAAAVAAVALPSASVAAARPLDLTTDAGIAVLAQWMTDYRAVSRAHWVIAAPTREIAEAKRSELKAHLAAADANLLERLEIRTVPEGAPRAWLSPALGSTGGAPNCAWQVWVDDPAAPGPGDDPILTPLNPNDRIPVGPAATFRVGHAGLVQSHLYAFGETRSGAIRDLTSAPDVNIPVTTDPEGETIVLATSRQPSPFLESLKSALAQSQGERVDLGARYDVRDKMFGARGIGANIQAIPDSMIASAAADAPTSLPREGLATALLESCVYQMTPRR